MTKQNPDQLCEGCRNFDKQFENGLNRLDTLTICDHEEIELKPLKNYNLPIEIVNEAAGKYANQHWIIKSARHKKQQKLIQLLLKDISIYANQAITIKLIRISPRMLDHEDNLPYSFKWAKDSIADLLVPGLKAGMADGSKLIKWDYGQEKGMPKEKALRVEIYER